MPARKTLKQTTKPSALKHTAACLATGALAATACVLSLRSLPAPHSAQASWTPTTPQPATHESGAHQNAAIPTATLRELVTAQPRPAKGQTTNLTSNTAYDAAWLSEGTTLEVLSQGNPTQPNQPATTAAQPAAQPADDAPDADDETPTDEQAREDADAPTHTDANKQTRDSADAPLPRQTHTHIGVYARPRPTPTPSDDAGTDAAPTASVQTQSTTPTPATNNNPAPPRTNAPTPTKTPTPTNTNSTAPQTPQAQPPAPAPNDDAPVAAAARPVHVYTWSDSDQQDALRTTVMLNAHRSPERIVEICRNAWQGRDPQDRVIVLAPWEMYIAPPFDATLPELVKNGPDMAYIHQWWVDALVALKAADLAPARIAVDVEHGINYWNLPISDADKGRRSHFRTLWNDPDAFAMLPDELKQYTADDIHWRTKSPTYAWNRFALDWRTRSLTETFVQPLSQIFPDARLGNYHDARYSVDVIDHNGWGTIGVMIGHDSYPVLYSEDADANLERLASVVADFDNPDHVIPWIKAPKLMTRDAFVATVEGAYDLGIRNFMLFNPGTLDTADDTFAADTIRGLADRDLLNSAYD